MTGSTRTAPQDQAAARPSSRKIAWTALRATGTVAAMVVIYYLLPLDHASAPVAVTILIVGLVVFIALIAFHVRSILRSPFPTLRAIEALAFSVPLFLLLFAGTYVVLGVTGAESRNGTMPVGGLAVTGCGCSGPEARRDADRMGHGHSKAPCASCRARWPFRAGLSRADGPRLRRWPAGRLGPS